MSRSPIVVLLVAAVLAAGCSRSGGTIVTPPPGVAARAQVSGFLTLVPKSPAVPVELPDVAVTLEALRPRSKVVSTTRTQLDGKFHLQAPRAGTYRVCWQAAAVGNGCGVPFQANGAAIFLGAVELRPETAVTGTVLTADGRPCWLHDAFFALDVSTRVRLLDALSGNILQQVRANVAGEYAFAVPQGRYEIAADCEESKVSGIAFTGGSGQKFVLPNYAPDLTLISATAGGKRLTRAAPGAVLRVQTTSRDADQDKVEYLWRTLPDSGTLAGGDAPSQEWKLASRQGLQSVYLIARDRKGGYAFRSFTLPAGPTDPTFSGTVVDELSQLPVEDAEVEVKGVTAMTNAQGWFSLSAPADAPPERYVLNVRHPDYALLSRIHEASGSGNTYQLMRAQVTFHDAKDEIEVLDTRSSGPCGPLDKGGKVREPVSLAAFRGERPKEQREPEPCRSRGARIVIPAGALVDDDEKPAQGMVRLSLATANPARRALPGDYRAIDRFDRPGELLSFGAVYAEFRDGSDRPLDLRANSSAEVRVPVSEEQLSSAKPTIALWSYNEERGLWIEEGEASLQNTPDGWMYIGRTAHFSYINMDVSGNDVKQSTCVRFEVDPSLNGWSNKVLRAYLSYAGQFVQVKETPLDGAPYHAILGIPFSPPAPGPNTLRLELRGTYNGVEVVLLDQIINTDARQQMTGGTVWPPPDYAECGVPIVLKADPINLPFYGYIGADNRPAFLTGPYGTFNPANGDAIATAYYNTIDPANDYPTLEEWWTDHGFAADGSGADAAAQYLNYNDLGFGRDMNCRVDNGNLYCYVTNYGLPNQDPANATAALNQDQLQRGATVAMEYLTSQPLDRRVRFYVYAPGPANTAGKLKFADLDGLGPKPVPHLCIVCHGGQYDSIANNVDHARFREFDLPSFKYPNGKTFTFANHDLDVNDLTAFAKLNEMVRDIAPATSPIGPLINAWYPQGFGAGVAPIKPLLATLPGGWQAEEDGYHSVYGESCRTCHIARDEGNATSFYLLNDVPNFAFTGGVVCGSPKVMPNAYVTYRNFWNDPVRVQKFKVLTNQATCE
jgi:hypothetical protein